MIDVRQLVGDLRFVAPVAAAWVVAVLLVGRPGGAWAVAATAAGVAVAGLVVRVLGALAGSVGGSVGGGGGGGGRGDALRALVRHRGIAVGCGLMVLTGALTSVVAVAIAVAQPERVPDVMLDADGRMVELEAVLDRDVEPGARSFPATARVVREVSRGGTLAGTGTHIEVPVRVVPARSFDGEARDDGVATRGIPAGTTTAVRGTLQREPDGGAASFVVFVRGDVQIVGEPRGIVAATDTARAAFVHVTDRLPEPGAGLLRGLAIGDRGGLDADVDEAMRTTSLTHLTAVSGSNCAVLVAMVMVLGRALRAPRWVRVGAALIVLAGFVTLVRPDPSIVRATTMAVVVLLVHLIGRPVAGTPLLAVAVFGMLVVDPWNARSFAFVLSVLATAGILVVAPSLAERLRPRIGVVAAPLVAVPVAAQAACWPVTVLLSPVVPTFAVPANLLAEPLAPVATVLGLAACVLAPLWPAGSLVAASIAWVPASLIAVLAAWCAALPGATIPWPEGGGGAIVAAVVSAGVVVGALTARRHTRLLALTVAAAVGVVAVGGIVVPVLLVRGALPSDWSIAACDIGQGDAVVVRDTSAVALVDTGDDDDALLACLALLGVGRIDLFVASHHDRDHIGAVPAIADRVDVALIGPEGRPADARTGAMLRDGGADVREGRAGTSGQLGRLAWDIAWPPASMTTGGNDASLVITFRPTPECDGCLSSTFLGDLGERAQQRYRAAADPQPVDVVKVSHHGSSDQDPALYRALAASVGLVSVGADNSYGHPTPSALAMLRAAGTEVVRTDRGGTIALTGEGGTPGAVRVWQEHGARDAADTPGAARAVAHGTARRRAGRVGAVGGGSYTRGAARRRDPPQHQEGDPWPSRSRRGCPSPSTRCRGPGSAPLR